MHASPQPRSSSTAATPAARRWLLLVHQLPASPSNLRVRTWRRLNQLGALPLKQAVYVLPDSPAAREDFEWLKAEIEDAGGEASVLSAGHVDSISDDQLVEDFRRARQEDFDALARDIDDASKRAAKTKRPQGRRAPALRRLSEIFQQRLSAIEAIDFFGSAGRDRVVRLLEQFQGGSPPAPAPPESGTSSTEYHGRLWVTRPRPGVDRMSSAWLIRRFIDRDAQFAFIGERSAVPEGALPFDMFGVEFSHRGSDCTFETLCKVFAVASPAVQRIAEIVHDLDLKDGKYGPAEGPTVSAMIDGLQLAHPDDHELLEHGRTLFESLYRSFEGSARSGRPRAVAKVRSRNKRR